MKMINLAKFQTPGSVVFSGRPRGIDIRKTLDLDAVDRSEEQVEVIIPPEVVSVNSSFFLGLFGKSVRALQRGGFMEKYKFSGSAAAMENIERGIDEALVYSNPLAA